MYKRKVTQTKQTKFIIHDVTINSLMKFGKYKYLSIQQILDRNAQYILWCIESEKIKPDKRIIDILINKGLIKEYNHDLNIVKK